MPDQERKLSAAEQWMRYCVIKKERNSLTEMMKNNPDELERMCSLDHLDFGTAGFRALMRPGPRGMNSVTIIQISQGLCEYFLEVSVHSKIRHPRKDNCRSLDMEFKNPEIDEPSSSPVGSGDNLASNNSLGLAIVLGFDGRHNSLEFAIAVAAVFISRGFIVYLFGRPSPTPLVPFLIRRFQEIDNLKIVGGVVITASHNPKDYNGYKIFAENGAQLSGPGDKVVIKYMLRNIEPWSSVEGLINDIRNCYKPESGRWDSDEAQINLHFRGMLANRIRMCEQNVCRLYESLVSNHLCSPPNRKLNAASMIKFVYTPIHGVGGYYVNVLSKTFGFPADAISIVSVQAVVDPDFPTTKHPNPEEEGELDIAMRQAEKESVGHVLANDPDADRFAACEIQSDLSWHQFSGDEIGILLADYLIRKNKGSCQKIAVLNTVVSSVMLKRLAKKYSNEGVEVYHFETLTGFKHIGNKVLKLQQEGYKVLIAYEEAIGFLLVPEIPDKDGISACVLWMQMITEMSHDWFESVTGEDKLESASRTDGFGFKIFEYLEKIKSDLGYCLTRNFYCTFNGPMLLSRIFEAWRDPALNLPHSISTTTPLHEEEIKEGNGEHVCVSKFSVLFKISHIRDVTVGTDTRADDGVCLLPRTPGSEMMTFYFDEAVITIRGSGTEPKIKCYIECWGSREYEVQRKIISLYYICINDLLECNIHGLTPSWSP